MRISDCVQSEEFEERVEFRDTPARKSNDSLLVKRVMCAFLNIQTHLVSWMWWLG